MNILTPLVIDINDAMQVYYDNLNANGGILGWTIDYIVEDTNYNVEQHLETGGRRYSHILDPRTGMPARGASAVTVVARATSIVR